jgi:hypothetical protein
MFHRRKVFLSDSRWRLMSKMPAETQSSVTWAFCSIFTFCILQCVYIFVSNTNQEHIWSNWSKWRFDPKWRIKIRFFDVTLREYNIFSIFFLHSSGLSKTQILWKKVFSKNPKWRLKLIFAFQLPSWIFY